MSKCPRVIDNTQALKEFEFIFIVLEWLRYKTILAMQGSSGDIYNKVFAEKKLVPEKRLEGIMKSLRADLNLGEDCWSNSYVALPPLWKKSDIVPLIWFKCDLRKKSPELRIYFEVYTHVGDKVKGMGFRFESPELPDDPAAKSTHDYWHVQITSDRVHNGPDWVPDHIPCLPAVARCPISLVLYSLRCFYDGGIIKKIANKAKIPGVYLEPLRDCGLI